MSMNIVGAIILLALCIKSCLSLPVQYLPQYHPQRPALVHSSQSSLFVKTFVFNCFPSNSDLSAFITFERDRVSRLRYGGLSIVNAALQPNSDFIVQFRETLTDIVNHNFTSYGFMEPRLNSDMQLLLVISRNNDHPDKPKHYLTTFDQNEVDAESSKLYIFNAVWNQIDREQGINVYGLYQRNNIDGSESESVMRLVDNLKMNEGKEISLEPNKRMQIKVTYKSIGSVMEFKSSRVLAEKEEFTAAPGVRHYLILYGDYRKGSRARPSLKMLNGADTPSSAVGLSTSVLPTLISLIILLVITILSL